MSFLPARIIRGALAPRRCLSVNKRLWNRVLYELRCRGNAQRESGAFLLGHHEGGRRRITLALFYDDLDPHALDSGSISLDGSVYARVFSECLHRSCRVVADVHTHPSKSHQSFIDRQQPMIREAGHVALIVPHYALRGDRGIGVNEYRGGGRWVELPTTAFYRGIFG